MSNTAEQGSPEWFSERAGCFTGSKFVDVMARAKKDGKPLKAWHDCVWQVVVERMTGIPPDEISAFALQWGKDVEPYARAAYELDTGLIVEKTGFLKHPDYDFAGASPDGLVGSDGGLEMKSPKDSKIHLQRFISGMEEDHLPQVQGGMWVTGRAWWDFVSYDPRMPERYRLYRQRVMRDEAYIKTLELSVIEANAAACAILSQFTKEDSMAISAHVQAVAGTDLKRAA